VDELTRRYYVARRRLQDLAERGGLSAASKGKAKDLARRMARLDAMHETMLTLGDLWEAAKALRKAGDTEGTAEIERIMTRLAREALTTAGPNASPSETPSETTRSETAGEPAGDRPAQTPSRAADLLR
jgi:hypothetical protein